MNDANMHRIRMLIETCPRTNHRKRLSKRKKEVEVGRHASHTRTLITQLRPLDGGTERIIQIT